jgi:uncharacterized protein (TIGR02646 family)
MQHITKSKEPKNFTEKKAKGIQSFDDLDKTELRTSLIKEQGYICCYCMNRIIDDRNEVRIEHWYPESKSLEENDFGRTVNYSNLLLACKGVSEKDKHCDFNKENNIITVNPLNAAHIDKIKYKADGTIDSDEPEFKRDIDIILNLNTDRLKSNRADIYDIVRDQLSIKDGTRTKPEILKILEKWLKKDANGMQKTFYMVAVYFLRKKLR